VEDPRCFFPGKPWPTYLSFVLCDTHRLQHLPPSHHITITSHLNFKSMPIHCYCNKCHGTLVHPQTKRNHARATLKNQTVSHQTVRQGDLAHPDTTQGGSTTTDPLPLRSIPGPHDHCPSTSNVPLDLDDGTLTYMDLDHITPHIICHSPRLMLLFPALLSLL
jgi:hypothetical protein